MLKPSCLLIALFCFLGIACQQQTEKKVADATAERAVLEIPKLLERPEAVRYGEEWDKVQNFYGQNSATLRANPDNNEARINLAEVFIQEARVTGEHPHYYSAAKQILEPAIESLSARTDLNTLEKDLYFRALSHLASVQLSLHDFATARTTAERAIAVNPYNAYIYGALVDANVELGDYKRAVECCDKMVSIRPDLRSYARVSYLREIHGDISGSLEAMDMAVKAGYPGFEQTEWARLQLGNLLHRYGKPAEARIQYENCLSARPDYPFALAALGQLESESGNAARAEELLKKAASIIPEVSFYEELAKLYMKTGRKAEADALAQKIVSMMQEDTQAGHNMAMEAGRFHLEVTGNLDEALRLAQEEYARRPENNSVNLLMGAIFMAKNQPDQARPFLQKASVTGSKDPELLNLAARIKI